MASLSLLNDVNKLALCLSVVYFLPPVSRQFDSVVASVENKEHRHVPVTFSN
jgi:hypothetical protein